ncbi:unnamed protein product [Spirodela intermedia]|uniref:Protein kinase domain-containing protein n=1 Tax=Spirodela intermedia TaxID=51605 RepID=A0A7I8L562_SPIIN|nr:unnamed protein product [Spirodela intermedia]
MVSKLKHNNVVQLVGYCVEGDLRIWVHVSIMHVSWVATGTTGQSTQTVHSISFPEYAMTGQLTMKSDIYSFGVILLELLTGRKPVDHTMPRGQQSLATPMLSEDKVEQCVDPKLNGEYSPKGAAQVAALAALCVQPEPDFRPNMFFLAIGLRYLVAH